MPQQKRRRAPARPDASQRPQFVDVFEFAAAAGVGDRTVRRWANAGLITSYRVAGRGMLRFDINELGRVVRPVPPESVSP
jgi:hypothetical protein